MYKNIKIFSQWIQFQEFNLQSSFNEVNMEGLVEAAHSVRGQIFQVSSQNGLSFS